MDTLSIIPSIGIGTYKLDPQTAFTIINEGLKLGYSHIDTAQLYKNEESVGKAIKNSGVDREKIFITTKVWITNIKKGKEKIIESVKDSLQKLETDYIDLLLVHAPVIGEIVNSWAVLEDIYLDKVPGLEGRVKRIGVSNYRIGELELLLNKCVIKPYANQIEITPFCRRDLLVDFCVDNDIVVIAHTSLTKGNKLDHQLVVDLGKKYGVPSAKILLKWGLQKGYMVLPRTSNLDHLKENLELDFNISDEDINMLDKISETYCSLPQYC